MNKERIERTVKLNLDFSLYKGKTRLKHWWPKVKEHFTQVQTAHNALEDTVSAHKTASELDHPSKSVKQRHIADRAVGQGQIADHPLKYIPQRYRLHILRMAMLHARNYRRT